MGSTIKILGIPASFIEVRDKENVVYSLWIKRLNYDFIALVSPAQVNAYHENFVN